MAYVRRLPGRVDGGKDAVWARGWTADAESDLVTISALTGDTQPRRGDSAYVTATGFYYLYQDDGTWFKLEALPEHDLLSVTHPDTIPASPVLGDVVYADAGEILGLDTVFVDGEPIEGMPVEGAESVFVDGSGFEALYGDLATVKWQRRNLEELVGAIAGGAGDAVKAYATSGPVLADSTLVTISFGATQFDSAGFWSAGAPSRLTIPEAGTFLLVAQAEWPLFVATAYVRIYKNGTKIAEATYAGGAGAQGAFQCSVIDQASAADYYELKLYAVNATASVTITAGQYSTFLSLVRQ